MYELTAANGGARLQAAQKGSCFVADPDHRFPPQAQRSSAVPRGLFVPSRGNEGFDANGTTIAGLCRNLSVVLDRDVIDKTGIAGLFDIHLELHFERNPADGGQAADARHAPLMLPDPSEMFAQIGAALQKLGLKLESAKEPGKALVIDSVERPSEN